MSDRDRPETPPPRLHAADGYSHAVTAHGRLVMTSGQVPVDSSGVLVGIDDVGQQADQVFANIAAALSIAGATMSNVVKLTYYLTSMADLPHVIAVRDRCIRKTPPPASTVVEVRALYRPEVQVEIEALAVLGR